MTIDTHGQVRAALLAGEPAGVALHVATCDTCRAFADAVDHLKAVSAAPPRPMPDGLAERVIERVHTERPDTTAAHRLPRRRLFIALSVAAAVVVGGAAAMWIGTDNPRHPPRQDVAAGGSTHIYRTMQELAAAADAVVVFRATEDRTEVDIHGSPFVVTTVEVQEVLRGAYSQSTMAFQEMPAISGGVRAEDGVNPVERGRRYLAFVVQSFPGNRALGNLWGAVDGGVGLYREVHDGVFERVVRVGNPLPLEVTEAEVRAAVG
jgi:hypothetical protein